MPAEVVIRIVGVSDAQGVFSQTSQGLRDMGSAADEGGRHMGAFGQIATGALRELGAVALNAAGSLVSALGDFVTGSISAAGDFQAGMNQFQAAAGDALSAAGLSVDDFRSDFLRLGQELPVSTADVQQACIALIKGGLDPMVVHAGGLESSLKFAAAAGMDLSAAAELSIKQLGTFVPVTASAAEQTKFLAESQDLLVKAAGASTLDVDKLGAAVLSAGGTARAVGVDYQDFITTMGLISPAFDSAATAGTSYKNFLVRLQPTTKPAMEAMRELNLVTADGKSKFYDSTGAFVGNRQAAALLQGALSGLSAAQRTSALQAIFGNDAMGAAVALANAGTAGYDKFADAMAKASGVQQQAATVQQGYNIALDNLHGSLEALQIVVGLVIIPILTDLFNNVLAPGINAITLFADAVSHASDPFAFLVGAIDSVLPGFAGLVDFISANAMPILAGLGAVLLTVLVPALIGLIPPLIALVGTVLGAVTSFGLLLAPLVAVGLAVGTLALAWQQNFGGIQQIVQPLIDAVITGFSEGGILGAIHGFISQLGAVSPQIGQWLLNVGQTILQDLLIWGQAFLDWIGPAIPPMLAQLNQIAMSIGTWIITQAPSWGLQLLAWGQAFVNWIGPYIPVVLGTLGGLVSSAWAWIQQQAPGWIAQLGTWGRAFADWVGPYIPVVLTALGGLLNSAWTWVQQQAPGWLEKLKTWGQSFAGWVSPYIPVVLNALGGLLTSAWGWVQQQAPGWIEKLKAWGASFVAWIGPAIPPFLAKLGELVASFGTWIGQQAAPLATKFSAWANGVVQWIPGAITNFLAKWPDMLNRFLDWIGSAAGPLLQKLFTWGVQFIAWIAPKIPGIIAALGGIALAIVVFIAETVGVIGAKLVQWGAAMLVWVDKEVLPKLPGVLAGILSAIQGWIEGAGKTLAEAVMSIGRSIIDGIKAGVSAAWEGFKHWISGLMEQIPGPIRDALKMHSPSLLMADTVGEPIVEGIVLGISRAQPKALSAMLDLAKALIDVVSSGVNAFSQLRQLGTVPLSSVQQFADTLQGALTIFAEMTQRWNREMMSQASQFTYKANQIIETMGKGLEFLLKLADLGPIPAAAFRQFGDGLDLAMREIIRISTVDMRMGLSEAVFFAEAATKIVAMIGTAVDALAKLKDFSAPAVETFRQFALAITDAVGWISHVAGWFQDSAVAAAANFADGAGKVVAIIGTAVDAFAKLEGFEAPSIELFHQFALAIVSAVGWISHVAGWFRGVALDDTTAFADAAGKIIGIIGGAVDAFLKLHDFKAVPGAALQAFTQALLTTIQQMAWLSTQWAPEVVAAAGVFAENAGKAVAIIGTAVDGFLKLVDLKVVPYDALRVFSQSLLLTIQQMAWLATQWAPEVVAAAGVFAENAGKAIAILGAGVDAFVKLADYKGVPYDALNAFTQTMLQVVQQMAWLALQWSPQMVAQAATFAEAAGRVVGAIGAAVEAFTKLADFHNTSSGVLTAFTQGLRDLLAEVQRQVLPTSVDIGTQIMQGIAQGITAQIPTVLNTAISAIRAVVAAIRAELGIASPSKVFAGLGIQIPAGLAQGVAAGTPMVTGAVRTMGVQAVGASQTTYNTYNSYNLTYDGQTAPSTGSAAQDIRLLAMLAGA